VGAEKKTSKKSDFIVFFLLSHTKLLTSIAYQLKQLLSYFMHRTNSPAFFVVAHFSPLVSAN